MQVRAAPSTGRKRPPTCEAHRQLYNRPMEQDEISEPVRLIFRPCSSPKSSRIRIPIVTKARPGILSSMLKTREIGSHSFASSSYRIASSTVTFLMWACWISLHCLTSMEQRYIFTMLALALRPHGNSYYCRRRGSLCVPVVCLPVR